MKGSKFSPRVGHTKNGDLYVEGKNYLCIRINKIDVITELGEKEDSGLKVRMWDPYGYYAGDMNDIVVTAEVENAMKALAIPHGNKIIMEVTVQKLYMPICRHKKKRVSKKWRKYGYIESDLFVRGTDCEVSVIAQTATLPKTLFWNETRLVWTKPTYEAEVVMHNTEYKIDNRRITLREYEEIKRSLK